MTALNKTVLKQQILDKSNLLPILVWAALGLGTISTLMGFFTFATVIAVARKDVPSLVQLESGQTVLVGAADSRYRTDEVITSFVQEAFTQMFTWNVVSKDGESRRVTDPGISVGSGGRIPTRTWQASFSISQDFRESFLIEMANSFIPKGVFTGEAQSTLLVESLTEPREVKEGEWAVDMVAFLVIFDGRNPQGKATSFNKTVVIKAVEPSLDPIPEETSAIQKAVYATTSKGLVITEIYELGAM